MNRVFGILLGGALLLSSCEGCGDPEPSNPPEIRWANSTSVFETSNFETIELEVVLGSVHTERVTVDFETVEGSATPEEDYIASSGTIVFEPGEVSQTIELTLIIDEYLESDEEFEVVLSNPVNGYVKIGEPSTSVGIRNDDDLIFISDDGYQAADSYEGMTLVWSDEFEGTSIDLSNWTYDLGNGSGGWGNNELETYTNSANNSFVADGKLFIKAEKVGDNAYTSARMKTQGLHEFQYGRIDVRALLPKGQGIWPAIWMLGANHSEVGWPACGEIDIMELLGHLPGTVHGTAHWGIDWPNWNHQGLSTSIYPDHFDQEFHVFSIDWQANEIRYLMDDEEFFVINTSMMNGQPYPFNNPFFFILNVAVGGNWPGYPDETTAFPVFMAVDYVRVYQ
ncbi:MAG: family 16 glycosylhydrolase [Flavobacteriales bacterium]